MSLRIASSRAVRSNAGAFAAAGASGVMRVTCMAAFLQVAGDREVAGMVQERVGRPNVNV
jgi:hypothetical protein